MLSRAALLALLPVLASAVSVERGLSGGYNYDRCDETYGPDAWPGSCLTQQDPSKAFGTPIDLCDAVPFPDGAPTVTLTGYDEAVEWTYSSDGSSIKVTVAGDNRPSISAGNLAFVVGRSAEDTEFTWNLEQMHLHWGRTGNTDEGSEHYMQGKAYAAEAHFVHYNSKYASFSASIDAALDGASDALLVTGFFLEVGNSEAAILTRLANRAAAVTEEEQDFGSISVADMMIPGDFYSYGGGLTTPQCYEIVTWIVFTEVQTIKRSTLQKFWNLYTTPGDSSSEKIGVHGNWRPLQGHGGRTVYISDGTSDPCGTVSEPEWECTDDPDTPGTPNTPGAGFSNIPSMVLPLSLLLSFVATLY